MKKKNKQLETKLACKGAVMSFTVLKDKYPHFRSDVMSVSSTRRKKSPRITSTWRERVHGSPAQIENDCLLD